VLFCALLRLPQGKDSIKFLEGLVTGDIAGLADGTGSLSVFTNEKGGIIDDTVITKVGGEPLVGISVHSRTCSSALASASTLDGAGMFVQQAAG
jgi:glycine cleavage system aminomethyltransferase T